MFSKILIISYYDFIFILKKYFNNKRIHRLDEKEEHVMRLIHTNLFVFLRKETRDFKQRVLFVRQIVNKEKQVEVLEQKIGF